MPPRDLVHAPDGRTWFETVLAEAEKLLPLQEEIVRLRGALINIHNREWASGDVEAGAKHASEMWSISDAALGAAQLKD